MAVPVPKSDKIYTTIYDNFKGVDYTNDASNVYRRRSPSGLNMLPDLDGKPFKRKGWDIVITADEFRTAAGASSSVEITPERAHYFEVGGEDYIMFFNNLGAFSYSESDGLVHHGQYVAVNGTQTSFGTGIIPDGKRGFFFEGKGIAGFYMFVGIKLFLFTGEYDSTYGGKVFYEVDPYVPTFLIACDPSGAGTEYEDLNMLTSERIIQYTCDGTEVNFVLPGGINSYSSVEVRNPNTGEWTDASDYTVDHLTGIITFETAPPVVVDGEDNMRISYVPKGTATAVSVNVTTDSKDLQIVKTITEQRERTKNKGVWSDWGDWAEIDTSPRYGVSSESFNTPNININPLTSEKALTVECRNSSDTGWTTMDKTLYDLSFGAYDQSATVTSNSNLFNSSLPIAEEYTQTTTIPAGNNAVQTRITQIYRYYKIRVTYTKYDYTSSDESTGETTAAFSECSRVAIYGSGIINQVFLTASTRHAYNTRVWYSAAADPSYFPQLNYFEVGATDKPIMGTIKVGEYLGIIKKSTGVDTSIYLAYPTSFEENTAYAVKQSINGIGAVSNGAFNILNDEPLFLSSEGVMGIDATSDDVDRQVRNRSYYVNKKLCAEDNLGQAVSFVYDGMYFLGINSHCYVLDGAQMNSWANTKTNLQYEAYYLDNVPAQCFMKHNDELWFTDFKGNVCRFMTDKDEFPYHDAYSVDAPQFTAASAPVDSVYEFSELTGTKTPEEGDHIQYGSNWYTITEANGALITVGEGVSIKAVWSTIADDDGAVQYFKNLQKKGNVVSLMPASDSGVKVYVKADSKAPVLVGVTDAKDYDLPFDAYVKKKVKKYKRLQFICENNSLNDSFGLDQIIKSYTIGNYSKNKR